MSNRRRQIETRIIYSRIYSLLLRLHPAAFRDQFGRDMALDFEDALDERGFRPLLGDACASLARQWRARLVDGPEFAGTEMQQPVAGHPFLSGQYIMVGRGPSVTPFDLARASLLSILLLLTIGFAASVPNRRIVADAQTARGSPAGGIETSGNAPSPTGGNQSRRERPGADPDLAAPISGVGPIHGRLRLGRGAASAGWGPRASGGPPARAASLANALGQLALISIIIWLTSFFFRRSPGIAKRIVLCALGLLGIAASVAFASVPTPPIHAQILHATAPLPSFEVATVKPWQPPTMPAVQAPVPVGAPDNRPAGPPRKFDPGRPGGQRTDRVHVIGQVSILLQLAFNLPVGSEREIVGAPSWVMSEADRYEVQAKIDSSLFAAMQTMTPAQQREQVDLLEQSLLADRFKLKVHFETREQPAFALVVAKGGSKLSPAKPGETTQLSASANETTGTAVTLDQFVHSPLLRPEGRIVIDQTGLTGAYDFTIKGEDGADPASFFTLIQEQLGLKLVPTKAPTEVIVIDHIERPTEN